MAVLSWGKPKVEVSKLGSGGAPTTWATIEPLVQSSSKLTTAKGNKVEAKEEGGGVIDTRNDKTTYAFETEQYIVKEGQSEPISDTDGYVDGNYALRLTPEDPTTEGWIMDKTNVSIEERWDADKGKTKFYSFDAIKPETGKTVKPYKAPVG